MSDLCPECGHSHGVHGHGCKTAEVARLRASAEGWEAIARKEAGAMIARQLEIEAALSDAHKALDACIAWEQAEGWETEKYRVMTQSVAAARASRDRLKEGG